VNGQTGVSVGHEDLRSGEDGISTTSGGLLIDQAQRPRVTNLVAEYS